MGIKINSIDNTLGVIVNSAENVKATGVHGLNVSGGLEKIVNEDEGTVTISAKAYSGKYPIKVSGENISIDLSDYYNVDETNALLDQKQNNLIAGEHIQLEDVGTEPTKSARISVSGKKNLYVDPNTMWMATNSAGIIIGTNMTDCSADENTYIRKEGEWVQFNPSDYISKEEQLKIGDGLDLDEETNVVSVQKDYVKKDEVTNYTNIELGENYYLKLNKTILKDCVHYGQRWENNHSVINDYSENITLSDYLWRNADRDNVGNVLENNIKIVFQKPLEEYTSIILSIDSDSGNSQHVKRDVELKGRVAEDVIAIWYNYTFIKIKEIGEDYITIYQNNSGPSGYVYSITTTPEELTNKIILNTTDENCYSNTLLTGSHIEGLNIFNVSAIIGSHIEGNYNTGVSAIEGSHIEGRFNFKSTAYQGSHIEGHYNSSCSATDGSHIDGFDNRNSTANSGCKIDGVENSSNSAFGGSNIHGFRNRNNTAISGSHIDGILNTTNKASIGSHIDGYKNNNNYSQDGSVVIGYYNETNSAHNGSVIIGSNIKNGYALFGAKIEGYGNNNGSALYGSVIAGNNNTGCIVDSGSHIEGSYNKGINLTATHVEGLNNNVNKASTGHIEGYYNFVTNSNTAHVEGRNNTATNDNACHIGGNENAVISSQLSVVYGDGHRLSALATANIFGKQNYASSISATTIDGLGHYVNSAEYSYIGGYQNNAKNLTQTIIWASNASAESAKYATIFGRNHKINTSSDTIFVEGYANTASECENSHIGGYDNEATSSRFLYMEGRSNDANSSINSHIEGQYNYANNSEYSHIEGSNNYANSASYSHIGGYCNTANGIVKSFVDGSYNNISGIHNFAFGERLKLEENNAVALGKYNKTSSDVLMVIGNGSDDSQRSDAFIVSSNGTISANKFVSTEPFVESIDLDSDNGIKLTENSNQVTVSLEEDIYNMLMELSGVMAESARSGVSANACVLGLSGNNLTWLPMGIQ